MTQHAADPSLPGLLWAMRFDAHGRGHLLPVAEPLPEFGSFGDGFLWLHLDLGAARLDDVIAQGRLGPQRLAAAVFGPDQHQRVTVEGAFVGGVVADLCPETGSAAPPNGLARLHFVMGPRFLVSGRRRPIATPEATREAAKEGGIVAPIQLLESMVRHVIASIAESGTRLSDELDTIEDHILDSTRRVERRRIGPVRRDAVRLHRQLLGLRAVFHRLEEDGAAADLPQAEIMTAARIAQRLDALDRDMSVLAERSRLLQEEVSTRLAETANRQLYTLSILSALFLPPALITGFFGMNTKGLPLANVESGSWIVLAICVVSAVLAYAFIRLMGIRMPRE